MRQELENLFRMPTRNVTDLSEEAKVFLVDALRMAENQNSVIRIQEKITDIYDELEDFFPSVSFGYCMNAEYLFLPNGLIMKICLERNAYTVQFLSEAEIIFGSQTKEITPLAILLEIENEYREAALVDAIDLDAHWM